MPIWNGYYIFIAYFQKGIDWELIDVTTITENYSMGEVASNTLHDTYPHFVVTDSKN